MPTSRIEAGAAGGGRHTLIAILIVVVAFLVGMIPVLAGRAVPPHDADGFFGPMFGLVADHARAGRLLLWNPWSSGGAPHHADHEFGAFSPLVLLIGLIVGGSPNGFIAYWLANWALAGVGMVVLARSLGGSGWVSVWAGLSWIGCGYFLGHAQHPSHVQSIAALPWILWRVEAALTRGRMQPMAEAGALWGLAALAGYHGVTALNGCFVWLWVVGRCSTSHHWPITPLLAVALEPDEALPRASSWPRLRLAAGGLCLFMAVGIIVAAPPFTGLLYDTQGFTSKIGPVPRDVALHHNALRPGMLTTFASAYLGAQDNDVSWWMHDPSMASLFLPLPVWWLALLTLIATRRGRASPERLVVLLITVLALLFAMSDTLPLRGLLYDWLPPMRLFYHSAHARGHFLFGVMVLGLMGLQQIRTAPAGGLRGLRAAGVAVAALHIVCFAAVMLGVKHPTPAIGWGSAEAVLAVTCLLAAAWSCNPPAERRRGNGFAAAILMPSVLATLLGPWLAQRTALATDPQIIAELRQLQQHHNPDLALSSMSRGIRCSFGPGVTNKSLYGKHPVLESYEPLPHRWHDRWIADRHLADLALSDGNSSRCWFAPTSASVRVRPSDDMFAVLQHRAAGASPPMVLHDAADMLLALGRLDAVATAAERDAVASAPAATALPVDVVAYEPNRLCLRVVAPAAGWLLVTDRWARGWSATRNGQPAKLLGGWFIFRAVAVEQGVSEIEMTYHATGQPWLTLASWLTLVLVAAAASAGVPGIRTRAADPPAASDNACYV